MKKDKENIHLMKPTVWIGKSGITESIVKEVSSQVKKKDIIKVKILKAALDEKNKHEIADELITKTGAELVKDTGFVLVLQKKRAARKE